MMKKMLAIALVSTAFLPSVAMAETFDFAGNFGASVFQYGVGTGGGSFTTLPVTGNCVGNANFPCRSSSDGSLGVADLPAIGVNTGTTPIDAYTFSLPGSTVFLHPGAGTNSDAILAFVAPQTATYSFTYHFSRLDTTSNGNGVTIGLFVNGTNLIGDYTLDQNGDGLIGVSGSALLNAGDRLSLAIGNNGEVSYDSTGLVGSVGSPTVPEPSTWAMMMVGFGMVGFGLRARRNGKVTTRIAFG